MQKRFNQKSKFSEKFKFQTYRNKSLNIFELTCRKPPLEECVLELKVLIDGFSI